MSNRQPANLSLQKAAAINTNAPSLSGYFYINAKGRVSYYRRSAFRTHFEVYNKGIPGWEYATAMTEDRLYKLPATFTVEDSVVEMVHNDQGEVLVTSVELKEPESILCNNTVQEVILEEIKKEEEQTVSGKQLDSKTLIKLMQENLHPDFLLKFTPKERNYYIVYDYRENQWDYSSIMAREMQTVGVTYTNSLRCVESVVDYLNENNYTI